MIVSLPYHVIHQLANINARGENWRKRKREEVLTFSCSRQGVGDGQIEMSWTDFILSLILIHLCLSSPNVCSSSNDQLGFIWADIDCYTAVMSTIFTPSLPLSAETDVWRKLFVFAVWPDRRQMSTTAQEVLTQDLRCDVLSQGSNRKVEMCNHVCFIWGGFIQIVGWNIPQQSCWMPWNVRSGVGSQCCERPPVFNVTSVRMVGGPALTAAPPPDPS